eukprot:TRINITY_DN2653_c1_g1_i4.p1 TRINITY_DN2653_c1_g1~~TRINITY_DN2653_c1_g1_i4.p1  ORF type:complete len:101 (-),score=10.13 TRINITY_DN2653_c1_g1_i4:24-326(-)
MEGCAGGLSFHAFFFFFFFPPLFPAAFFFFFFPGIPSPSAPGSPSALISRRREPFLSCTRPLSGAFTNVRSWGGTSPSFDVRQPIVEGPRHKRQPAGLCP